MASEYELRVLGTLAVVRAGESLALPPSRKTRALLAYLAVLGRPQRRERLCEIFWEIPDDPRGALRWSLSRIRSLIRIDGEEFVVADRNTVGLRPDLIDLDIAPLSRLSRNELGRLSTDELEELSGRFTGRFLEDLFLPRCPEFEAWRVAMSDELDVMRIAMLRTLVDRLKDEPARALHHAHALLALAPDDVELSMQIQRLGEAARRSAVTSARDTSADGAAPAGTSLSGAETSREQPSASQEGHRPVGLKQEIRYCRTPDGVRLAYALSGSGPPIVKAAHWLSHLEHDWNSPIWPHWISELSARNQLVRYDERGNGLSDREVDDLSFDALVADLEAIVDAAGLRRFCLLGVSQGCAISIAYAVRHPDRVSSMVLYGGYPQGWRARGNEQEIRRREAMETLIRDGWGQQDPVFRQIFTSLFIPGATHEQMDWFNELQRVSVTPETAVRLHDAFGRIDVMDLLPRVTTPTLVMHGRDDAVVPLYQGQALAEGIPGARFVMLESGNHILLHDEPAFPIFMRELRAFASGTASPEDAPEAMTIEKFRRQVTVLVADLVSPLQSVQEVDPEAAAEELAPLTEELRRTIETHRGHVSVAADGEITAVFGLSHVTEDHAYLACRAALAMAAAVEQASTGTARLRAGIDTGEVIVRHREDGDGGEELAGAVPRQAGQLMRSLQRGTIALSARTSAAAGGYVQTVRMRPEEHPQLGGDTHAWELLGENRALSRWHIRANQGLTVLIGREEELATLKTVWRRVREGRGQVVGVVADPGLGKSRIVHEFISHADVTDFVVVEAGALEFDVNVSFQIVKKLVRAACGIDERDPDAAEDLLRRRHQELDLPPEMLPPLVFLLDLAVRDPAWVRLDGADRASRVGESARALLLAMSRRAPLVLLVEDLHWLDRESETVLQRLSETIAAQRILLLATYRPEYQPPWSRLSVFHELRLEPFDEKETRQCLDAILGKDPSLDTLKPMLAQRTDQTPLFLEETVRALAATGDIVGEMGAYRAEREIEDIVIPANVKSLIATRIDRLAGEERTLLQVAAVIGKEVPAPLLRRLAPLPAPRLDAALKHLQSLEFLFELQSVPVVEYTFKHALTHRVAYQSLLTADRQSLHRKVLRAMEELYVDTLAEHVEKLASHAYRAEEWETAANYLLTAADRAIDRSAYDLAAKFLEHARIAVDALPESTERAKRVIDISTRMRPVYAAIGAFDRAAEPLAQARRSAIEIGDEERLLKILIHQSYLHSSHGRIEQALEAADALKEAALKSESTRRYVCEADLAAAQAHLMRAEAAPALARLEPHRGPFLAEWRYERFGQMGTRSVWYLGHLAQAQATLGRFAEATEAADEALQIAAKVGRPIDIFASQYFAALVEILRGPGPDVLARLREATMAATLKSGRFIRAWLLSVQGHVEYLLGQYQAASASLEAALGDAERFDLPQFECYARTILACARSRLGEAEAAANLQYVLSLARARKDRWSEILSLRAIAERSSTLVAVEYLEQAVEVAEGLGCLPELSRTLRALAELQARQGLPDAEATGARAARLAEELGLAASGEDFFTVPVAAVAARKPKGRPRATG